MPFAEVMPAVNAMLEDAWTSGGITLEQKSTDASEEGWIAKYF